MHDNADTIVDYEMDYCTSCGEELLGNQEFAGRRQVVDIPPRKAIITEHRIYSTICQCGKKIYFILSERGVSTHQLWE
ncbi:MAG: hypothetical protein ACJATI_005375 [Halioglobus sp.]|jgi:hypothetical protein